MSAARRGAKIIALCGKGGVGKTVISASIVKILLENRQNRVLAIDADPAVGLALALGIEVKKTVDDVRNDLIRRVQAGESNSKAALLSRLDYEMFAALVENENLGFLAIGRPEKEGCYCQVNHLLKDIIASLSSHFDYVVIDGEAGLEQVNRRVMASVNYLILVSDASAKGLQVAKSIHDLAGDAIAYKRAGLILNRIRDEAEEKRVLLPAALECLGRVPEDDVIRGIDMRGQSILGAPDCAAISAVKQYIGSWGIPATANHA